MNTNTSNKIRFSIIIPTFNRSEILAKAIKALCEQEEPGCKYEIVPVDNGSKDNTREVVESLSKENFVPIRYILETKSGSHFARNTGFKAAYGEILGLIDDDVFVDKNWVKNIVKAYDNPEVSCAGGKITVRWVNGSPAEWIKPFQWVLGELDCGEEFIELKYPQMINAGNFSIRKDVLIKAGGYNPCNAPKDNLVGDGECGLCTKVYNSGGRVFWVPNAGGWHIQDAQMITLPFMRRRAKYNGMSSAFSFYRSINGSIFKILTCVPKNCSIILFCLVKRLLYVSKHEQEFYKYLFRYDNTFGFLSYLLKIKTNRNLCNLVLRDDWLNI